MSYPIILSKQKFNVLLAACLLLLCFITIVLDLLFARWQNTSFFLSESLLFSTFWLLFFPILNRQLKAPAASSVWNFVSRTAASVVIHIFAYPALVWFFSLCFYYHTFDYWQTFNFGLTEHGVKAIIIYSLTYSIKAFYTTRLNKEANNVEQSEPFITTHPTSIVVTDSNNRKVSILVSDVLYCSANPPYVNIHHTAKRYLQAGSLKSLEVQLQAHAFVRIHKSFLVNIQSVVSYQSRLNGDYDLTLSEGTVLRVSRNYAAAFKKSFDKHHQVNTK